MSSTCIYVQLCCSGTQEAVFEFPAGVPPIASDDGENYFVFHAAFHWKSYLVQKYRIPSSKPRERAVLSPESSSPGIHVCRAAVILIWHKHSCPYPETRTHSLNFSFWELHTGLVGCKVTDWQAQGLGFFQWKKLPKCLTRLLSLEESCPFVFRMSPAFRANFSSPCSIIRPSFREMLDPKTQGSGNPQPEPSLVWERSLEWIQG